MSRIFISASHKSSGKTTISIGLCRALDRNGLRIQSFKKGPDYIDPMWLSKASGRACYNLDFYTMDHQEILNTFISKQKHIDLNIIEGNKGLYDGLNLDGSNSNAALAKLLDTPIILVIDARGMTRGIAPLILGYQSFDKDIRIAGVILNQVGGSRHEDKLRNVIEYYTDVPVIGSVYRDTEMEIIERHLGLIPSNESDEADKKINILADRISQQIDTEELIRLAGTCNALKVKSVETFLAKQNEQSLRIGIARDAAFGFYYSDDLEEFARLGTELVPINMLTDTELPEIDGLIIGGGFPETHMEQLEANGSMRHQVKQAIDDGLPCYAECGGLMYLCEKITWNSRTHKMADVIPGEIIMHSKPQGRGYIRIKTTENFPWPLESANSISEISAHEFHYSSVNNLPGNTRFAFEVTRGTGIDGNHDGIVYKNLLACYAHLRNTRQSPWVSKFIDFVRQSKKRG